MGMAASQVRFLSLQNRKNTVGLNLMTLSNRKLALSRDMNRIANEYNDAMNLKTLKWSSDSGVTYNDLSYDMLMKPNDLNATLPYIVTDANGRVVVDDSNISFDGFTSDYSYRDLATLISTYSGTDSKTNLPIYDNVGNVNGPVDSAISGNASLPGCEYTNVSDVNQYDIKGNSLRYDLLSKLGVISEEDYESFLAASANVSGNAIGESFTNWEDVLDKYIKDGGMTNTGSPVTLELSDKDGNVEEVSSSTYFGTWDPTKNTFVGGCAKGNLAVAKYELDQYQSWCGELHKANLNSETTHTFTGISGITLTQSTDSILSSLDEATDSPDNSCTTKTLVDGYTELGGDFSNWTGIYNSSTASIEVTGFTGQQLVDLLTVMGGSLFNAFTSASNTEGANADRGWSLSNQISDDDYNIDADKIEEAISSKTKAIFLAHTLGNSYELDKIKKLCEKHNLWLIEDSCDALGGEYKGAKLGTIGHIGTFSFYPAHHITMGEGGAVVTNDSQLYRIIMSFRDWGRDCWCKPGKDDTCKKRFGMQLGNLPFGYDHKYTYSHIGFNLKITDWQAALGCAQLKQLPDFLEKRSINAKYLMDKLSDLNEYLILPEITYGCKPSWFGFLISVKPPISKQKLVEYLECNGVGTRQLFAGNILRQPMIVDNDIQLRIGNSDILNSKDLTEEHYKLLPNTDFIMNNTFWVGVFPALSEKELSRISDLIHKFIEVNK